jgi:hypothetical protein
MKTSNKILLTIILCVFVAILAATIVVRTKVPTIRVFGFVAQSITGNGHIVSQPRNVSDFNAVDIGGANNVIIKSGAKPQVVIKTDQNLLPFIKTFVSNNVLYIHPAASLLPSQRILLTITTKNLQGISVSGANKISAKDIKTKQLQVDISGSGECNLAGRADNLQINVSGSGNINAKDLIAEDVAVGISGDGKVVIHANQSINARISGSGKVQYYGNPSQVTQRISGSGEIQQIGKNRTP